MSRLKKLEFMGIIFIFLSLFPSLYLVSKINITNSFIKFFVMTNDSLWQVGKFMFISLLGFSIYEYFKIGKEYNNFFFAKLSSIAFGPFIYILFTYNYDMIFNVSNSFLHFIIFFLSLVLSQLMSYYFLKTKLYFKFMNGYAIFSVLMIYGAFSYYTFYDNFSAPIFKPMKNYVKLIK